MSEFNITSNNNTPPKCLKVKLDLLIRRSLPIVVGIAGCGFFDGLCHTLAYSVHRYFEGTTIFHISRSALRRDHSVVYFPSLDKYFDADGFQTHSQLFTKMYELERVNCRVLMPFNDFNVEERVLESALIRITDLLSKTALVNHQMIKGL